MCFTLCSVHSGTFIDYCSTYDCFCSSYGKLGEEEELNMKFIWFLREGFNKKKTFFLWNFP